MIKLTCKQCGWYIGDPRPMDKKGKCPNCGAAYQQGEKIEDYHD